MKLFSDKLDCCTIQSPLNCFILARFIFITAVFVFMAIKPNAKKDWKRCLNTFYHYFCCDKPLSSYCTPL